MSEDKYLKPLKQLDSVLEYLNEINPLGEFTTEVLAVMNNSTIVVTEEDIFSFLRQKPNSFISHISLGKVVEKLKKDEHITKDENNGHLSITWDGRLFISQGGYVGKVNDKTLVEKSILNHQATVNRLTFWVALGTCGLLAWDVIKYLISILKICLFCKH